MPDVKPPRLVGDERTTLLALLQYHRESVVKKVADIDEEAAQWSPVASGTSLLGLVQHLADAETLWVVRRFAGERGATAPPSESLEQAVDAYRATWSRVAAIVGAEDLEALCRGLGAAEAAANLRWVLTHLLEETARHAGHADIIRELIDGQTGR
jgi:uncharacterized damage-inducible protein DinB